MPYPSPPKPSAWVTADMRAAHQLYDDPLILLDPLALRIVGARREAELRAAPEWQRHPLATVMRATMAVRARLAEDAWREAEQHGARQYVILGAGLDTYAYRAGGDAIIYEVDLPEMQQWKRACLQAAAVPEPETVRYVATDLATSSLMEDLQQAHFNASSPACYSWLGVSMYLKPDEVMRTLQEVADCAAGSSIVFDYCVHRTQLNDAERAGLDFVASSLAAQGEPLRSSFDPQLLEHMLRHLGFRQVEHFGPAQLSERYLAGRSDNLRLSGIFRMIRATV